MKEGRWVIYGKELPRNKGTPASRGLGSLTKQQCGDWTEPWTGTSPLHHSVAALPNPEGLLFLHL